MRTRHRPLIAVVLGAISFFAAACAAVDTEEELGEHRDRQLDEYVRAIDDALADLDVDEADAAYERARERLRFLKDIPYARKTVEAYHPRLVERAARVVDTKRQVRDMVRVVLYRGYDPERMGAPDTVFRFGSLAERLQSAPPHRRAEVERMIAHFLGSGRDQYRIYLRRMAKYRNHIERVFAAYGIPQELLCVAMIESAGDPKRVSPAGAAGLWQFIPETARRYRLVVGRGVDQRFDPILQTYAAAAYLRDLLDMFGGDVEPALAGYNCGESYIANALASTGLGGFWTLMPHGSGDGRAMTIPKETYDYVARFFAVGIIYQNLERYGFDQPAADDDPFVMLEMVGSLDLDRLAADLNLDPDRLALMNSSFVDRRADAEQRVMVRLPAAPVENYVDILRGTRTYRVSYVYRHRVTNYETFRAIAEDYGVSPARIALHNNLDSEDRLKPGILLHIPTTMRNRRAEQASERNVEWWRSFLERNAPKAP
ncbi:MAG: transglycosylase SLT domain-containing protein [Deltaproteobacteria bacterium]|nr:transglycosylase SLT domain-containing protein [Deltaproteobacteria bacterium]